jgi:hypothetical protein
VVDQPVDRRCNTQHKDYGKTKPYGCFHIVGYCQERTHAQKIGQQDVSNKHRIYKNADKIFHIPKPVTFI